MSLPSKPSVSVLEMQCYLCNAIFALPQPLQQHMLTKHGVDDRPYECLFPQCEQKFFFRAELENHAFIHQPQSMVKASSMPDDPSDVTSSSLPISCPTCGIAFTSAVTFNAHLAVCSGSPGSVKARGSTGSQSHTYDVSPVAFTRMDKIGVAGSNSISAIRSDSSTDRHHSRVQTRAGGKKDDGPASDGTIHYCPHCTKTFQSLSALQGEYFSFMVAVVVTD